MKNLVIVAGILVFSVVGLGAAENAPATLDACNVVTTTPATNAAGSVPVGNGELGASVWIEPNGDVLLYLARPDSFSEVCRLLKVGKVRVSLSPAPLKDGLSFRQELKLRQGRIEADLGGTHLEIFVDASRPVLRVTGRSAQPVTVRVTEEGWRTERRVLSGVEANSAWTMKGLPASVVVAESADVMVPADRAPAALAWYHHNAESVVPFVLQHQSCDPLPGFVDPLTHRTFGAWVEGRGFVREGARALVTAQPAAEWEIRMASPTLTGPAPEAWMGLAQATTQHAPAAAAARQETERWWNDFWNRSWILVSADGDAKIPGLEKVSAGYTLTRYAFACQGRGEAPIKFNGGMFTVEPGLAKTNYANLNPDFRQWGDGYWWQNTRHMYHPMLPAGDFELMAPLFATYHNARLVGEARVKKWYQAEGTYFPETMSLFGTYAVGEYGFDRKGKALGDIASPWWRYAWNQGPELVSLMLDYWDWTGDEKFVKQELIPTASSVMRYFDTRFHKDARGLIVLNPCQVIEMYRTATNDQPTIAGLRAILPRLQQLPAALLAAPERVLFDRVRRACPPLPVEERKLDGAMVKVLAPAESYLPKASNTENPEIYPIWPYRLFGVGKPELEFARNSYFTRGRKLYGGWGYDANAAALLGLPDEAGKILISKCGNSDKRYRFPATWGPNYDWIPDQNHGGNLMNTAQLMLLQYSGQKLYLLPAWPKGWNCEFRLHAPGKTLVTGSVAGGRLTRLEVTPAARRADIEVCAPYQLPAP